MGVGPSTVLGLFMSVIRSSTFGQFSISPVVA
jgi:hypothetical protein